MSSDKVIEADKFYVALNKIFDDFQLGMNQNLEVPITKACKEAKKVAEKSGQYKDRTGVYRKGFGMRVNKNGRYEAIGYVGNRKKPGLVHLLEKGHINVITGGRTRAFPHMIRGAEAGERVLVEECGNLVEEAWK